MSETKPGRPGLPEIDVNEYGGTKDGERQCMNQRLFMQLMVFDCDPEVDPEFPTTRLIEALESAQLPGVIYDDVSNPHGLGLLNWSDDPILFVEKVRPILRRSEFRSLRQRRSFTMLGRTYASGHERDLKHWLLSRPVENVTNPDARWAVWYPLRRTGAFEELDRSERIPILREHASIGMAYGKQELAHDVRLACHGLDQQDNEFVIGLIGATLHPLSHVVQRMRSTRQTREFIAQMGPFFVGHARWQSRGPAPEST